MERLPSFKSCYFCGSQNPRGLKIAYFHDPAAGCVRGWVELDEVFCGYPGVLHGGFQSALLDDAMYWAVSYRAATSSVTVDLGCRFLRTARLGQRFELTARCGRPEGRKVRAEGSLADATGEVVAQGSASYLLHPREQFVATMLPHFDFQGCSPAIVEHFARA